jgi:hypothetical protein
MDAELIDKLTKLSDNSLIANVVGNFFLLYWVDWLHYL